jgi:inosine/xanthosine triphosphate pyrophosphatase family protein
MATDSRSKPGRVLICATTNTMKFNFGKELFAMYDIELQQVVLDIAEIQGEDPEAIIRDKAKKAYAASGQPVLVTDDSWSIPGLNGFPGPYMKSMNQWFSADDFIRLTRDLKDRTIFINQFVAFKDELETVVFRHDIPGKILEEPRGNYGPPILKVVALDGDDGLSISETYDPGEEHETERLGRNAGAWQHLADWYAKKVAT